MILYGLFALICISVYYFEKWGTSRKKHPPLSPASMWKIMTSSGIDRLNHFHAMSKWCQNKYMAESTSGTTFLITTPFFSIGSNVIVCCDYKLARIVLSGNSNDTIKECEKTVLIQSLNIFDNVCSLLTYQTANPQRVQSRKFIAPSFSTSNLQKTTLNILYNKVKAMVTLLDENAVSGSEVDMKTLAVMTIFDILTESLFDVSLRNCDNGVSGFDYAEFLQSQDAAMREAVKRLLIPFRSYMTWIPEVQAGMRGQQKLVEFAKVVLQAYRESKGIQTDDEATIREYLKHDKSIMAHILCNSYPSEEHRLSDVVVFLIAGHETTAHTLSFFMYCMAKHPKVQANLQQCLDALTPTGEGSLLTLSDLAKCDFLSNCLKESQRLFPVAPLVSRATSVDIPYNDIIIPKHSTVLVSMWSMFRQEWINQPLDFLPERWDDSAPQVAELKEMFMPFSIGKRSCIGQNLALMELRVIIANIFRNFNVTIEGCAPELDYFVTLKPVELRLQITKRAVS